MRIILLLALSYCLNIYSQNNPQIIAHRGATSLAPENTLSAFQLALDLGVDFLEMDVRISLDDSLMVIHDSTVNRTTNSSGGVNTLSYNQLKSLDAGSHFSSNFSGEQIPSLREVLLLGKNKTKFCIELKDENIELQTLNMLQSMNLVNDVIIFSFDLSQLQTIKSINPLIKVCYLANPIGQNHIDDLQIIGGEYVGSGGYPGLGNIIYAQNKNIEFWMWTLNDTDDMQYRMSQGIDGIITDNPQDLICLNTLLMNAGLVAHWNFDEGIGTVLADNSGNNNSGFIYGANWANGITGGALEFNGSSDYVNVPITNSLKIFKDAVSISAWIYMDKLPSDISHSYGPIFDSDNDAYILYLDRGNEEVRFKVKDDDGDAERPGIHESYLSINTWHNIVGVYNGHNAMIYLDGNLIDYHSNSDLDTLLFPNPTGIGHNNSNYFDGKIDEIKIYNRALSPNEVAQIANQFNQACSDTTKIRYNIDSLGFSILEDTSFCDSALISYDYNKFYQSGFEFDGVMSYVNINSLASELHNSSHSFFTWVKTNNENQNERIFSANDMYGENVSMFGIVNGYLDIYNGSYHTGNTNVDDNNWHFVGYTWNKNSENLILWLNGNIDAVFSNVDLDIENTDFISLGQEFDAWASSNHFKGYLHSISIWNKALSTAEILDLMNNGISTSSSNLIGCYSESSNCPNELKDISAYKNNGVSYLPIKNEHFEFQIAQSVSDHSWVMNGIEISDSNSVLVNIDSNSSVLEYIQKGVYSEYFENINFTINNAPVLDLGSDTTICKGTQHIITAPINYLTYLWNDGTTGQYLPLNSSSLAIGDTVIWLMVSDSNGCQTKDTMSVNVVLCTNMNFKEDLNLNIYPNPVTSSSFRLDFNKEISSIKLMDLNGRLVQNLNYNNKIEIKLDRRNLESGLYLLSITDKDRTHKQIIAIH